MNKEWQKEIQRKALQYREVPVGVDRSALERRMAEACAAGRRRMMVVWSRRLVAAAAIAALVVPLSGLLWPGRGEAPVEPQQPVAGVAGRASVGAATAPAAAPMTAMALVAEPVRPPVAPRAVEPTAAPAAAVQAEAAVAEPGGGSVEAGPTGGRPHDGTVRPAGVKEVGQPATRRRALPRPRAYAGAEAGTRRRGGLRASAYVANAMRGSTSGGAMATVLPMADPIGEFIGPFAGRESELLLAQTEPARTEVNHHAPVRVGLSVSLPLGRRWAVESGLVYSYLYSGITSGNANCTSETDQRLHYVGIPVAATYTVWSNRRFAVYAKAGGMVEKMVSGRADTRTIVDGREESSEREHISIGSLQLSVNGAVGAEWRFADRMGAYIEPGVSYSFDNGSSVPTFYADKPLAFNLAFGLRFGLADRK